MKIYCLSINSEDNLSGVPKWEWSLSFAYLQAYYNTSSHYDKTEFVNGTFFESTSVLRIHSDISVHNPDILAVSCYCWSMDVVLALLNELATTDPQLRIILGGPEISLQSEHLMETYPAIDVCVVGEGEITFTEVLDCYHENKSKLPFEKIDGVLYRDSKGQITYSGPRGYIQELDQIPSPFQLGLIDLERLSSSLIAIETQRGCILDCAFCNYQKGNRALRYFSLERVAEDLQIILKHQPKTLYLMDPTFNSNKRRAKFILSRIIENNSGGTTINAEMLPDILTEEIITMSVQAGFRTVEVGIQSLNPKAVKLMGRYRHEEKLFRNISLGIEKGLYLIPQIIIGLPGDTYSDFLETFNRVYPLPTEELDILILLLLPHTSYRAHASTYGIKYNANDAPYEIIESNDFSKEEMRFLRKFREIVLVSQPMKIVIAKVCEEIGIPCHELFNEFIDTYRDRLIEFNWPIHNIVDKDNGIKTLDLLYEYIRDKTSELEMEETINELGKLKKRAQFMLAARFMRLPSDNSFQDTSTDYPDRGMVAAQKQRVNLARANELL